jgi:hypothetical protein
MYTFKLNQNLRAEVLGIFTAKLDIIYGVSFMDDIQFLFMTILFLIIVVIVGVPIIIKFVKAQKSFNSYKNGVKNYDTFMREFCYRVDLSACEIKGKLSDKYKNSILNYNYNSDDNEIVFIPDFTETEEQTAYHIEIKECGEYSLLKIVEQGILPKKSWCPYKQNEFWFKKLGAVPIEYF